MTTDEFDAPAPRPRRHADAGQHSGSQPRPRTKQRRVTFHATIADVTDEQHQNMPGLVQEDDFDPDVVTEFLYAHGIEAWRDESGDGFHFKLANPAGESKVRFACVCLRAAMSYALEAAFWATEAQK